jgi:hypothetical protein
MTEEELRAAQADKKRRQHEAWKRWYESPKGQQYAQKRKLKKAQEDDSSPT